MALSFSDDTSPEPNKPKKGKGKGSKEVSGGCLMFFAILIAAAGVFMTGLLVVKLVEHHQVQSWVEVPATILSAELESHRSDDGTSYKAIARYEYEYAGRNYSGDRVGLIGGADNMGKYQKRTAELLKKHLRSKKPFMARVDPNSPGDAILFTELRLGLIAIFSGSGLVFSAVGFGMLFGGIYSKKSSQEFDVRKLASPDAPWEWGVGWKEGKIPSSGKLKTGGLLLLALFWNAITLPLVAILWDEIFRGESKLGLLFLVLPLIGLLMAWNGARSLIRQRKFGGSVFEMAKVPGVIGGQLAGAVITNKHLDPSGGFVQRLVCLETATVSRGGKSRVETRTVWEDERILTGELMADDRSRSAVPVLFAIPFEQTPTDRDSDRKIVWQLQMEAAVAGIDYFAEFEVPVFKTEESSATFVLDESPIAQLCAPNGLRDRLERTGASVRETDDGMEIKYPMFHNPAALFGWGLFTVIWIGITILLPKLGAPILFPIVFGLCSALFVLVVISQIFTNKRLVLRESDLLYSSGGIFGGEKRLPYTGLAEVKTFCGMRSNTQSYFSVKVRSNEGRNTTLTPNLRPASTAEALVAEIERRIDADSA